MDEALEMLKAIYDDEDITLGVHGTSLAHRTLEDTIQLILQRGLMCRYYDIRRTIGFQDPAYLTPISNLSFDTITHYSYCRRETGVVVENIKKGNITTIEIVDIPVDPVAFIFAMPAAIKTNSEELFAGPRQTFMVDFVNTEHELSSGKGFRREGRPIDPRYIVGYYTGEDIKTFVPNPKFYGFKEGTKGTSPQDLDFDKIKSINKAVRKQNRTSILEMKQKRAQRLAAEALEEQKDTKAKKRVSARLKSLVDKLLNKNTQKNR